MDGGHICGTSGLVRNSKGENVPADLLSEVFLRDASSGQYCGRSAQDALLHVDYEVPLSIGGRTTFDNL